MALLMVLDTARPRYKENTTWLGMRGNAVRKSTPKANISQEFTMDFSEIQFYRESQLAIGWSEQQCKEWDELANEDHTYKLTQEERRRYKGQRYLTLNQAGKNGPMKLRSDYRAGEPIEEPFHPGQQRRIQQGQEGVFQHLGRDCVP